MATRLSDKQIDALKRLAKIEDEGAYPFQFGRNSKGNWTEISTDNEFEYGVIETLIDIQLLKKDKRVCRFTQKGRTTIQNNFQLPQYETHHIQQNIGNFIQHSNISGGNFQSVGLAQDQVSQMINDPVVLRSQVELLIERLLNEVKAELASEDLFEYSKAARELKQHLLSEQSTTDQSLFSKLVSTLAFLDVVNGTTDLMVKVWPLIYPLIQIANELSKGISG